jgi:hypothetical protein
MSQPHLKRQTCTVYTVSYGDLDDFIADVYRLPQGEWSIVSDQELSNDSSYKTSVHRNALSTYDQKRLDDFKAGKNVPFMLNTLLTDCANYHLIPEGDYVIEISW